MIQRVQTLFLLGAIICLGLCAFFPIMTIEDNVMKIVIDGFATKQLTKPGGVLIHQTSNIYLLGGVGLAILIGGFSISQYKNRVLQMKLGLINNFVILAVSLVAVFVNIEQAKALLPSPESVTYGLTGILIFGAILLTRVANVFIKKDEDLVRSVDRIR